MKRIAALFMAAILSFVIMVLPGYALSGKGQAPYKDIPGVTNEEIAAIDTLIRLRGGFTYGHLLETEAFLLPDGTFAGFTIELCKLLSDLFGTEFTPVYYGEWGEMNAALGNRSVDFTGGFTLTTERARAYYMTVPIAGRALEMYTLKSEADYSVDYLNGKRIGSLFGTTLLTAITERYPTFSFEVVNFSSYAEGVDLLEAGEIDAIIATNAAAPRLAYDTIMAKSLFSLAYYPVAITSANAELAPVISVINKYLEAGGIDRVFTLFEEGKVNYDKNSLFQSFTDEEKAYINRMLAEDRKVDIGLQHDAYPASFYNDTEHEFQGVSIDILKGITKLTGLTFEPLSTSEDTTLAVILEKLKNNEIAMMTQLLKTESRENDYIWSEVPYLTTHYALLSRVEFPDIQIYQVPWEKVGTVYKSAHEVMFETWFPNHEHRIIYDTTNDGFNALEHGEIDLLMLSENMLLQQTNLRQRTQYKVNVKFDISLDSFFGFSKDEAVLRSIVDKTMEYIDIDSIASGWMSKVFDYQSEIAQMQSRYLFFFLLAVLAALFGVSVLFIKNKRLSKSLTENTAMLSAIYKSMPDTIFSKNTEGAYTSCNPSFEKQAGLPEAEIIGKTYAEVFKERALATAAYYRQIDKSVVAKGITSIVKEEVFYPDGSRKLLEMLKAPLIHNGIAIGIIGMGRDITERQEIASRLESIINAVQIAFILSIDGYIIEVNQYGQAHVGMKVGDDIRQFYANPEQRVELLEWAERYGTVSNSVVYITIANGEVHRFLTSITLTEYEQRKAHIVWALDIEEDERRNDLLRVTQLSFQTVLDTLPMPILIVDLESRKIVYVNSSLCELFEYDSPEALYGMKINETMPVTFGDKTDSAAQVEKLLSETDHPITLDMEYLTKSGRVLEAVVAARYIDYRGRRSSIGIIKDLTEEKKVAQILRESAEREREANQAKSLFLANMSHEIRTPMNGIIGMTDLLLVENMTERQRQYTKDIKASSESLLGIINDILDLSKITEGKLQITPVDIDLSLFLKNAVSMMRFSAQSKGLYFIDDIQIAAPEYVRVDDVRLNQIIANLLSNAIKFTHNGYVKLSVKIENAQIVIEVSDTGIGIMEEDVSLIFTAFEQADQRKNRAIKGTGLGLSITKNLVELMGGLLRVESRYGLGSTFTITLPHVPGDESAVKVYDTQFEYIYAPEAKILLVDDIQTNLTVGEGLLRLCGITADTAGSGYEAIERVKAKAYDIIFMDHMMPEMDGIETMNIIRALGGENQNLPIIALTANAVSESRLLLLSSGMDDFLSKPIDKTALINMLKKWLPAGKIKEVSEMPETAQAKPYSKALLAASNIAGLDVELSLSRIGGLCDVLEKSMKQLAFSINGKLAAMDSCLAKNDLAGFALDAHGLKGALANIGAAKHAEIAAALEAGARAGNLQQCVETFAVFVNKMEAFGSQLKNCFTEPGVEKPAGDSAALAEKLAEAIACLDNFEAADASAIINTLTMLTFGAAIDEALCKAANAAENYNYSEAIMLLKGITASHDAH